MSQLKNNARDPKNGRPTPDPKVFMQLPRIKADCDAVVNITSGGSAKMSLEERLAAPLLASPGMASLNMGTMDFGLYPMGAKVRVGLEDSLTIGRGRLASSNAEQVSKIRGIVEELSLEVATPQEARRMLGLKGSGNVEF